MGNSSRHEVLRKELYPNRLTVCATSEMIARLKAVGFYKCGKAKMVTPTILLLDLGYEAFVEKLSPRERREFDEILQNTRIAAELGTAVLKEKQGPVDELLSDDLASQL